MSTIVNYPGRSPGASTVSVSTTAATLENAIIGLRWALDAGRVTGLRVENRESGQIESVNSGFFPSVVLADGRRIEPDVPSAVDERNGAIVARFEHAASGLTVTWSAHLNDGTNAVVQTLELTATADAHIRELVFIDTSIASARQVGAVAGSVVVCGDLFMGVEHPLAQNRVGEDGSVRCALALDANLSAGDSITHSCAIGVVPPGQLRRGFLYYIEQRRAHPYRPFLHYNNWYDVWLGRQTERITEPECLAAIEYFGRELVERRGVTVDAMVWDDGWDDFNTLWDFHKGFPQGFKDLDAAASKYGIAQGVWMSPNGGYATAKAARIAYGEPLGYETNANGYAMGGPTYREAFRAVCLKMMREHGVVFFKFDGMGEGGNGKGHTDGTTGALSDDIHAVLELSRELHEEQSDVYVSATAGTWASPFWLRYADSIWRQGMDSGHLGEGDTRQQWITYRDAWTYERVVQAGPLYPLNALMLHGVLIGDRRAPADMVLDEKSVADEIWSFFGSGTCLQELYVSPGVPTDSMLDQLAAAAKWSRAHSDVLIDTHWIGGDPAQAEVYGWASWRPGKGILVLRNPSLEAQSFATTPEAALELPTGLVGTMAVHAVYPAERALPASSMDVAQPLTLELQPFETLVLELVSSL